MPLCTRPHRAAPSSVTCSVGTVSIRDELPDPRLHGALAHAVEVGVPGNQVSRWLSLQGRCAGEPVSGVPTGDCLGHSL